MGLGEKAGGAGTGMPPTAGMGLEVMELSTSKRCLLILYWKLCFACLLNEKRDVKRHAYYGLELQHDERANATTVTNAPRHRHRSPPENLPKSKYILRHRTANPATLAANAGDVMRCPGRANGLLMASAYATSQGLTLSASSPA